MFDKIKNLPQIDPYVRRLHAYLLSLRDIRNVGMLVFVVITLLISWSGIKAIQLNYNLQKQIARLQQENTVQNLKDSNLQLQNQYYNTNQYLEVTARQNLGLGLPGESELIVPHSVAMAHTVKLPGSNANNAVPHQPAWQRHFEAWTDFFLHRQAG